MSSTMSIIIVLIVVQIMKCSYCQYDWCIDDFGQTRFVGDSWQIKGLCKQLRCEKVYNKFMIVRNKCGSSYAFKKSKELNEMCNSSRRGYRTRSFPECCQYRWCRLMYKNSTAN